MNPISDLSLKHYSREDEKIDMENQENMLKNQEKLAFFKKKKSLLQTTLKSVR